MTNQEFLWWIHERLRRVHGESEFVDYMHHLRAVIVDMDSKQTSPKIARMDTDFNLLSERFDG